MSNRATPEARAAQNQRRNERRAAKAREANPALPPYTPRAATHGQVLGTKENLEAIQAVIADGQELKAQTVKIDDTGAIDHQYVKTQAARAEAVGAIIPPAHLITKTTTRVDGDGRVGLQYLTSKPGTVEAWIAFYEAAREEAAEYKGISLAIETPAPAETWKDYLSCYWLGDPHIGMLAHAAEAGAHFDLKIAEAELVECFRQLVAKTPPSRIGRIVNLGDFYHAETAAWVTPGHGHKLDGDGRPYKVQKCGQRILRSLVDLALQRHEFVEFDSVPGNHDPNMSFQICSWLQAVYEGNPRVSIADGISPYSFREFGATLLGTAHGNGARENALPGLMATRQPQAWGRTKYRQFHNGHIHHTRKIEHSGCLTWYHNTLASKDAWAALMGFDSDQFLESTTYHERFGPDGSQQVGIERVRAALEAMKLGNVASV